MPHRTALPDVIVLGGGLVGLASAAALSERSLRVLLIGERRAGEASPAAAGMLAPSLEPAAGAAQRFAVAARDHYPEYLQRLSDRSGVSIAQARGGILQVALSDSAAEVQQQHAVGHDRLWLNAAELSVAEPALSHASGATHYPRDGAVDNVALIAALERLLEKDPAVTRVHGRAARVATDQSHIGVVLDDGTTLEADWLVLAAGAWTGLLGDVPRKLPVEPVRGQMVSLSGAPVRHVTYGPRAYLVPREHETLVGATVEHVGFDCSLTPEGRAILTDAAREISSALSGPVVRQWSGLRPMTPDGQPIIGPDPAEPRLIYACGHSRQGVLLAPLTGSCIAALVSREPAPFDLTPFRVDRFGEVA
ncbi:MAG: FAD-dependent oxidoreductase [Gemmatimonadota bacterium]|nr:FAD-dependent oxidoreductase [Gemmatimonadota bacterium]